MTTNKSDKYRKLVVGELLIQSRNDKSKTYKIDIDDVGDRLSFSNLGTTDAKRFVINTDGSVTFIDFPPELLDIAYALNPDDPLVCERRKLLSSDP